MFNLLSLVKGYYPMMKRLLDILLSSTALVVISPLLILLSLLIFLTSKGPTIFWSERVGHGGKVFRMPKFRSMTECSTVTSRETASLTDITITPFGNILRKTSLDELPQLWSVLKGDMSLVGPRPLLPDDNAMDERFSKPQIFDVRPGMTGLAQINGRNYISPRNKIRYDLFYAEHFCLFLDMKILFKTIGTVLNVKMVQ